MQYAGYIGGLNSDRGRGIAVDGAGNAYVAGVAGGARVAAKPSGRLVIGRGARRVEGLERDDHAVRIAAQERRRHEE